MSQRRRALALALGLYAVTVGSFAGMLLERVRFDEERAAVLARVSMAEQRLHARLMELERHEAR